LEIGNDFSASLRNIDEAAFSVGLRAGDTDPCGNMTTPTRFPLYF
jgi:hypothetical protein